jgi:hypothetical protein
MNWFRIILDENRKFFIAVDFYCVNDCIVNKFNHIS